MGKESRSAVAAAVPHGRSKMGAEWTFELVAYGLDRFHKRHLRTPTVKELREGVDDLPSYATIRRRYGSAGRMLRRHGYRVRNAGAQPGRPCLLKRNEKGLFLPKVTQLA
jgi:hypothetical protein